MRESWDTGRFWYDYRIWKSFKMGTVYWAALHEYEDGLLSSVMLSELKEL
jgi:hypothetical protein